MFNMKFRLIVFDVDGTLTSFDEPVSRNVILTLKYLENLGIRIALSSGKHLPYLEGIARDLEIRRPIIIAENGCAIVDMADSREIWLTERPPEICEIRKRIMHKFSDSIWEQPNKVEFTFSPKTSALRSEVITHAEEVISHYRDKIHTYGGSGSIDVLPVGIDKGVGLAEVKRMYGFKQDEVVAIGDGENDIPMFKEAGLSLIVGTQISHPNALSFNTIVEVLDFLTNTQRSV
jgi:HAD superfamily hydrolase (TIGR01484 family)